MVYYDNTGRRIRRAVTRRTPLDDPLEECKCKHVRAEHEKENKKCTNRNCNCTSFVSRWGK